MPVAIPNAVELFFEPQAQAAVRVDRIAASACGANLIAQLLNASCLKAFCITAILCSPVALGQDTKDSTKPTREQEVQRGSQTAKGGFQNEDEIRNKFNEWQKDSDARGWLETMGYTLGDIVSVAATKPHGEKADVEVRVKTGTAERVEGISIKLVSNPNGFNQIDKRWLKTYAKMWQMPANVHEALSLFVGEKQPEKPGKDPKRLFLNEMDEKTQKAVLVFFETHREQIVSDLFAGDGDHAAGWIMVTLKNQPESLDAEAVTKTPTTAGSKSPKSSESSKSIATKSSWVLCSTRDAADFFGEGKVQITPAGSLKIGRITMQRKGGDNGRETANQLQFKVNPVDLFDRP